MGWPYNGPCFGDRPGKYQKRISHIEFSSIMFLSHGRKGLYGSVEASNDAEI
jgi:hypothetical protein